METEVVVVLPPTFKEEIKLMLKETIEMYS
jgi:hypothetical protein